MGAQRPLSWLGIVRLGLVQTALGSIVVLTTSTLNRVMVVELALPAIIPGALVAVHYAMQIMRPRFGHGSDLGARRTPWIIGGMATLAVGGICAALATASMGTHLISGIVLAALSFAIIGIGVGACGTSLLVLLATRVEDRRRGAAATCVWTMMIAGFAVTAGVAGHWLDPFSFPRLVGVTAAVCCLALIITIVAVWNVEGRGDTAAPHKTSAETRSNFRAALADVWAEQKARRFAIFVFLSMLAYGAQDLILDPFAGRVFGMTPGGSTKLSGVQHAGVLVGMILVGFLSGAARQRRIGALQSWAVLGCVASALSLLGLAAAGFAGPSWPLRTTVFILGISNGVYAVAAIGSMMALANAGRAAREGVRMGLWGAAQATAFGLGGFVGTFASDAARYVFRSPAAAYSSVFLIEAALFFLAAVFAARVARAIDPAHTPVRPGPMQAAVAGREIL